MKERVEEALGSMDWDTVVDFDYYGLIQDLWELVQKLEGDVEILDESVNHFKIAYEETKAEKEEPRKFVVGDRVEYICEGDEYRDVEFVVSSNEPLDCDTPVCLGFVGTNGSNSIWVAPEDIKLIEEEKDAPIKGMLDYMEDLGMMESKKPSIFKWERPEEEERTAKSDEEMQKEEEALWSAYNAGRKAGYPKAKEDDWIDWKGWTKLEGSECPINENNLVDIRYFTGSIDKNCPANLVKWGYVDAYRIVKEPTEAQKKNKAWTHVAEEAAKKPTLLEYCDKHHGYNGEQLPKENWLKREGIKLISEYLTEHMKERG